MEMCRVCLTAGNGMDPLDECFIIQYNLLTDLNIALLDGMPQFSCKSCLQTLKCFIEFREKAIASERTLREIIYSDVKAENKHIVEECKTEMENESLKNEIKCEIKLEREEDNDSTLDTPFEEYMGDLNNLIKDDDTKRKKTRKKKKKDKKTLPQANENISDDVRWFCGICPETFEDKIEIQKHLDIHNKDRQCELCKEKVNSLSQLLAHRLMHVPPKQFNCHICAKRYRSCLYLEHHYRNVHIESDDPRVECKLCQATYNTAKRLSTHMIQVHSSMRFYCDVCSKGFSNKTSLRSHIQQHSEIKCFVCDLCGFSCNYSGGLKDHKIRRHSPKKIYCKNCTRPFSNQLDYDRHKCKSKLKVCPICGVQITGSSRLSSHMVSHSDVFRFECNRCPAKYKTKPALIAHINRHDGNRTKQCEYCPAKFYTTTVLIKHRRIHTGEKPFVCRVCNKGFTGGHNLKVHMKVHGEYLIVKRNTDEIGRAHV